METNLKTWKTLSNKVFYQPIADIVEEAVYRELAAGHDLTVCVGTDSHAYTHHIQFATAVMIVRKGKGAFAFIHKDKQERSMGIKERMIAEVAKSVEVAYQIAPILEEYEVEMELHVDINTQPEHKSQVALKDAMGYILGMGYVLKAKPFAFASSSCADTVV